MVALKQQTFLWYEPVYPPNHPDKSEHVRNYWRRPKGSRVHNPKRDKGLASRITLTSEKSL